MALERFPTPAIEDKRDAGPIAYRSFASGCVRQTEAERQKKKEEIKKLRAAGEMPRMGNISVEKDVKRNKMEEQEEMMRDKSTMKQFSSSTMCIFQGF